MKRFAALYSELDRSTATGDKRAALVRYFQQAPPHDAAWALFLLAGGKVTSARQKIAGNAELRTWVAEMSDTPAWLVDDSYSHVGDLAETLARLRKQLVIQRTALGRNGRHAQSPISIV